MQREWDTGVADPILRIAPQVSGYQLIARRGRGGVAEVWEAVSPGSHRVALKLVHLSTDLRSGELRALKITRGIRHPGPLTVHGAWQVEDLLVISMELADRSLWDRFLEANGQGLRGIPRGELLGYLGPVADAIDYLNGSWHTIEGRQGVGIQHRDLKPQNLLLFGDRAKVGDFGMARVMQGYVIGHSGPCTVPYAAPEYFSGRTAPQSDQYALGVTYCHLRGGRVPFPSSTARMAIGHISNAPDLDGLTESARANRRPLTSIRRRPTSSRSSRASSNRLTTAPPPGGLSPHSGAGFTSWALSHASGHGFSSTCRDTAATCKTGWQGDGPPRPAQAVAHWAALEFAGTGPVAESKSADSWRCGSIACGRSAAWIACGSSAVEWRMGSRSTQGCWASVRSPRW
jgi:serine/threonine protein kinase